MHKEISWKGVFPALLTPFDAHGAVDYELFRHSILTQLDAGVSGLILAGTLGEASTLSSDEKFALLQFVKQHVPAHIPVLLNVAEQATSEAVAFAQQAQAIGADGLMLLPPMRYRASDREVVEFFKAVVASVDIPILLYNNPVDYGIAITLDMFEELLPYQNIQAVKESTRDLTNVTRMITRFGERFKILCGVDTLTLESQLLGAQGSVAGLVNAFPYETVAIYKLAASGRVEEAVAMYRWFMPLLELDIHPRLVQYIKLAAAAEGLGSEHVRAPRLPLEGKERERVMQIIEEGRANRPALSNANSLIV